MASFYSVFGALELDEPQLSLLREILSKNEDANPYVGSWLFNAEGGFSCFAFFGHTVPAQALEAVRSQLQRICRFVHSRDGDYIDYPEGLFSVVFETNERESFDWKIVNGQFFEEVRV